MPRIVTSEAPQNVVDGLRKVAKANRRTTGKEALIAVESHVLAQSLKPTPKPTRR